MALESYHILELINQQFATRKDEIALDGYDCAKNWREVSWQRLFSNSTTVASYLIANGVEKQQTCAIMANNCPQWTVADIGCVKANAVVVPIYPTSTAEQVAYIVNDAKAKVIFVGQQAEYDLVKSIQAECPSLQSVVCFDSKAHLSSADVYFDDLINHPAEVVPSLIDERMKRRNLDDLITLIYTSGTTGNPKGVMLTHRNVASTIEQHDEMLPFVAGDVSLAFLPLSHVFERGWSYYVLARGGKNVYLSNTMDVREALAKVRPHTMCVVPRFLEKIYSTIYQRLASAPKLRQGLFNWAINTGKKHANKQYTFGLHTQRFIANKLVFSKIKELLGGRLKFMPAGGAALDADIAEFFKAIDVPVLVGYGMTETTATITCNTLGNQVPGSNGKPLPRVQIKIGKDNEILVKGDTVMKGYYNLPEATNDTFEDGWLKTGDAGYLDHDGNLFITDRIKELMKTSNGKYIAPQRVEGKLGQSAMVEQVAVIADAKNYVSALIVPAYENLEAWAKQKGINYQNKAELLKHSLVLEMFEQKLKEVQHDLANFEKVKKFTLIVDAFSLEEGLITPTMKLKRKVINSRYAKEIAAMYGAS
ncbi:long-chain fatty acid--CoA ligase [Paraferrimonas sp. SM1919]|uniref:AMP-dependent synthetase/ligase n=1 Tax=Paraferrimonas sp. SM1919 TaxID=2662263 RepID=UPI0013D8B2DF|nr:long-chain fatty acid--CoA ligase [Paraferrimonas sp. SM1919]